MLGRLHFRPAAVSRKRAVHWVSILAIAAVPFSNADAQRKITDFSLASQPPIWTRSGSADTTLIDAASLLIVAGRVYLIDPAAPAVSALDARSGSTLWRYSRKGHGPGEMLQPALLSWHPRGIVVVDRGTARLYLFSVDGKLLAEQGVPGGVFVGGLCSLNDGTIILSFATFSGSPLMSTRIGSNVAKKVAFPFQRTARNPSDFVLDLTSTTPAGNTGCVASRKANDGIAMTSVGDVAPAMPYIERLDPGPSKQMGQTHDQPSRPIPIPFSISSGAYAGGVYVWFGGKECQNHCIDIYSVPTLKYVQTLRFASRPRFHIQYIAIAENMLVADGISDEGFPFVMAFHLPSLKVP